MAISVLKSKIHRAVVTEANLNYIGSVSIDMSLTKMADIKEYEKVQIINLANGKRWDTYALYAPENSCSISINGGGARLAAPGDIVIIISYETIEKHEDPNPIALMMNSDNTIDKILKGKEYADYKNKLE